MQESHTCAPQPLSFRTGSYAAGNVFPDHEQPWGELHFALAGVVEVEMAGRRYLSPPHYALWIPPETPHRSWNRGRAEYVSTFIDPEHCRLLPKVPSTLTLSPLLKAILADFAQRNIEVPTTPEDLRLAMVVVDQVRAAAHFESYLPASTDPRLAAVLEALQVDPADRRSLAGWARRLGTTERTLSRHCQSELGMTFSEWRQRLKFVVGLKRIQEGHPVQVIARDLGYANTSAFIAMFRRLTGLSPTQMRGQDSK